MKFLLFIFITTLIACNSGVSNVNPLVIEVHYETIGDSLYGVQVCTFQDSVTKEIFNNTLIQMINNPEQQDSAAIKHLLEVFLEVNGVGFADYQNAKIAIALEGRWLYSEASIQDTIEIKSGGYRFMQPNLLVYLRNDSLIYFSLERNARKGVGTLGDEKVTIEKLLEESNLNLESDHN